MSKLHVGPFLIDEKLKKDFDTYCEEQKKLHGTNKNFIGEQAVKTFLEKVKKEKYHYDKKN